MKSSDFMTVRATLNRVALLYYYTFTNKTQTILLQLYFLQRLNINSFSHLYKHVLIHMYYSYLV